MYFHGLETGVGIFAGTNKGRCLTVLTVNWENLKKQIINLLLNIWMCISQEQDKLIPAFEQEIF